MLGLLTGLASAQAPDSSLAWLRIQAPGTGLTVRVDGRGVGRTPLPDLPLVPGRHAVSVSAPDSLDWLSRPFVQSVTLLPGSIHVLRAVFPRRLWLTSDPPGAWVTAGDSTLGQTPMVVTLARNGEEKLSLHRPGYAPVTLRPPAHSGQVHGVLPPLAKPAPFTLRHPQVHKPRLFWGTALAIALGAAGYWCQSRADQAYEDYLSTGHPDRMDTAFRRAETYDRWSGGLYVAGEACLVTTLYFSLKGLWR